MVAIDDFERDNDGFEENAFYEEVEEEELPGEMEPTEEQEV